MVNTGLVCIDNHTVVHWPHLFSALPRIMENNQIRQSRFQSEINWDKALNWDCSNSKTLIYFKKCWMVKAELYINQFADYFLYPYSTVKVFHKNLL